MGTKNRSGVRAIKRGGRKILIIDFPFRDKDGRKQRYRRDAGVQTSGGAHAEAERLMRYAVDHGTVEVTPPSPTLESFVRDQFVPLVLPSYSPATREKYLRLLWKEGVIDTLGRARIGEIGAKEFRLLESTVRARDTQPRQHLILLRSILKTAVEHGVIAVMPTLPLVHRPPSKLPSAPTIEVVQQLIDASAGWLRTAIALAFYACERSGEVRALRVADIDMVRSVLSTRRAFSHDQVWTTKGRAERTIEIVDPLRDVLADTVRGKASEALVVSDDLGRPVTRQKLYKAFVALQRRVGIKAPWSFHGLRHAFGTHAMRNGANVEAVRELMGHKDLETTARYLHAVGEDRKAVMRTFSRQPGGHD